MLPTNKIKGIKHVQIKKILNQIYTILQFKFWWRILGALRTNKVKSNRDPNPDSKKNFGFITPVTIILPSDGADAIVYLVSFGS